MPYSNLLGHLHALMHPTTQVHTDNALWAYQGGVLYIWGTNDWDDWQDNFNVDESVSVAGGKFHDGFATHAKKVMQGFAERFPKLSPRLIVGHSLGGAAAQYIAASWGVDCVTFGSPEPWYRLPTRVHYKHTRVQVRADHVTHLPAFAFKHQQTELVKLGKPLIIKWLCDLFKGRNPLHNHRLEEYERLLEKARDR